MQLNFKSSQAPDKCKLIQIICDKVEELLHLPTEVDIEFTAMSPSTYGDTMVDYKNQISIYEVGAKILRILGIEKGGKR